VELIKGGKIEEPRLCPVEIQKIGGVIRVTLLTIGSDDGLTTGQAAGIFNISESTILKHIQNHKIEAMKVPTGTLQLLKSEGVVHRKTARAIFIPRYGLRELMRVIGTDAAKSAYHQLFDDAEELFRIKPQYLGQSQEISDLRLKNENLESKLLDVAGQLKAALDRSAIDQVKLRMKDQQIAELQASLDEYHHTLDRLEAKQDELDLVSAKLQASIEFIENKSKGKRRCRQSVVEFEFAGVNIFEGPQYVARVKKLEKAEMNEREQNVFALQKGISSIRGIADSMEQRSEKLGIANLEVRDALKQLSQASDEAYHKLIPEAGKIFGLKDGESISYLN
jgi:excisionase family DNA binding protein